MPRIPVLVLSSPRAWSLILAPVRFEMIEAMRICAPCAIAQLASILDRPADSLYRHMDKLLASGVVTRVGVRRAGRRLEQVYDLVADDISLSFKGMSERQASKVYEGIIATTLKILSRAARAAARQGDLTKNQPRRHASAFLEHAWLTPEDIPALRAQVMAFRDFLRNKQTPGRGSLYVVSGFALPVARKRGAQRKPVARKKTKRAPKRRPR